MAGRGRRLPKWQATANVVPNSAQQIPCQKNFLFFLIFFICIDDTTMYNQSKERLSEKDD